MRLLYRTLLKYMLDAAVRSHRAAGRPALAGYAFDHITVKILLDGRFAARELAILEKWVFPRLAPGGICLDIGANIGNHSVAFADQFEHVHAFEPNPKALDLLQVNAKLRPNITVHPIGLSDRTETLEGVQPAHNLGGTGVATASRREGTAVTLPLFPLDEVAFDPGGARIRFVKIDVEGFEEQVIRGAANTLREHRPVIGMEVNRKSITKGSSPAINAAYDLGYHHMYAMSRRRTTQIRKVDKAAAKNHPLLLLSMDPIAF